MFIKQIERDGTSACRLQVEEAQLAFPLLSLPHNVRKTIYEYALETGGTNIIRHRDFMAEAPRFREGSHHYSMLCLDQRIWPESFTHALFTVNKQISKEALGVFYDHKVVDVEMAYEKLGKVDGHRNATFNRSVDDLVKRKSGIRSINFCYDICLGQPPPARHHRCFQAVTRMIEHLLRPEPHYFPPKIKVMIFLGYTQREWSPENIMQHTDFVVAKLKPFKSAITLDLIDTSFLVSRGQDILELRAIDLLLESARRVGVSFNYQVRSYQSEIERRGVAALWNAPETDGSNLA